MRANGSALIGSFGRHDQMVDATMGNPTGYLRFNGNRSEADDYHDGAGRQVPSAWMKWNAEASAAWTPGANAMLELGVGRGDGQARYAGRSMDGSQFLREGEALRYQHAALPGILETAEVSLYRNRADHVKDNYTLRNPNPDGMMPMPMAAQVASDTRGGRAAVSWQAGAWGATMGMDLQENRHTQRTGMGRGAHLRQPWAADARLGNRGVFVETRYALRPALEAVAGLRHDRAHARDLRPTIGSGMRTMPNPTAGHTRRESLQSGFARLQGGGKGALQWVVGLGHNQRMPDYWELFSPNRGPQGAANAFAGVRPETTTQWDAGVQYRQPRYQLWANAYAGRIRDYILFDYGSGAMPMSQARNVDADVHGLEAGASWRGITQWELGGSVAWAWGSQRGQSRPLPQMPPLEARLQAQWQGQRWSAGAMLRGAARQSRVALGQGNVVGRDLGPSAGFGVFSLNGQYRFNDVATLSAGVDNVFDRAYSEHLNLTGSADFGYPAEPVRIAEPGRNLWLKFSFRF